MSPQAVCRTVLPIPKLPFGTASALRPRTIESTYTALRDGISIHVQKHKDCISILLQRKPIKLLKDLDLITLALYWPSHTPGIISSTPPPETTRSDRLSDPRVVFGTLGGN